VAPTTQVVSNTGGVWDVNVSKTSGNCSWSATTDVSWISFPNGLSGALYGGGYDVTAHDIAKWDGAQWSALGGLLDVRALTTFDDGTGLALYAGSTLLGFSIARWSCL
jgi:hypothetical protein